MMYSDQNFDSLKITLQAKKRRELDAILENEEYEAAVENESDKDEVRRQVCYR